jgi:20S proteasome alpha/beta subunit
MSNLVDFEIDLDECVEMANDAMRVAMEDMDIEGELSELDMVETEEFIEFG